MKRAADAFDNLDQALQKGADLPEDWLGDDDDDDEGDGDDLDDVDPVDHDEDPMTDEEAAAEMRRVTGGGE